MNYIPSFVVGLLLFGPLSCWQQADSQAIRVAVDFKPEIAGANAIEFTGKTNLPAGTVMTISARPEWEGTAVPDLFTLDQIPSGAGAVETIVKKDGSFRGKLKTDGNVKTGNYLCRIEIPVYHNNKDGPKLSSRWGTEEQLQPKKVHKIIGSRGENLTGHLVKKVWLGWLAKVEVEVLVKVNLLEKTQAKVERQEKRKYENLLRQFQQYQQALIALHGQGLSGKQIAIQWNRRRYERAVSVESLAGHEAIKHLRAITNELEEMHAILIGHSDGEFEQSKKRYQARIDEFEALIDGIK